MLGLVTQTSVYHWSIEGKSSKLYCDIIIYLDTSCFPLFTGENDFTLILYFPFRRIWTSKDVWENSQSGKQPNHQLSLWSFWKMASLDWNSTWFSRGRNCASYTVISLLYYFLHFLSLLFDLLLILKVYLFTVFWKILKKWLYNWQLAFLACWVYGRSDLKYSYIVVNSSYQCWTRTVIKEHVCFDALLEP